MKTKFKETVNWIGGEIENYKWIQFQVIRNTSRTQVWQVAARDFGPTILGEVMWFAKWRKYAFFPENDTVFEQDCLRDLATFCQARNKEHRDHLALEKAKRQVNG
jgi:hypothetical protein